MLGMSDDDDDGNGAESSTTELDRVCVYVSNITQLAKWHFKTDIALVRPKRGMEQKLLIASARLAG